jgi:hypothetical protein
MLLYCFHGTSFRRQGDVLIRPVTPTLDAKIADINLSSFQVESWQISPSNRQWCITNTMTYLAILSIMKFHLTLLGNLSGWLTARVQGEWQLGQNQKFFNKGKLSRLRKGNGSFALWIITWFWRKGQGTKGVIPLQQSFYSRKFYVVDCGSSSELASLRFLTGSQKSYLDVISFLKSAVSCRHSRAEQRDIIVSHPVKWRRWYPYEKVWKSDDFLTDRIRSDGRPDNWNTWVD